MATEEELNTGLTSDDLYHLKRAKEITAYHEGKFAHLRFRYERKGNTVDYKMDVRSSMNGYGPRLEEGSSAHHHEIWADYYASTWLTIKQFARKGDRLRLEWLADNNTDELKKAGFHVDQFTVVIERGQKTYRFIVDVRCTTGGVGRMIQPKIVEYSLA